MTTVKAAIYNRLVADVTYLALLGVPTTAPYQTFLNLAPKKPSFPEVILTFGETSTDQEFDGDTLVSVGGFIATAWTLEHTYETILDRIVYLMHQKPFTTGFRLIFAGRGEEVFNEEFDAYGKQVRFDLHYRRETI